MKSNSFYYLEKKSIEHLYFSYNNLKVEKGVENYTAK